MSPRIFLGFVPWVLFTVVARRDTPQAATLVALIGAVVISVPSLRAGRPKTLELAGVGLFAILFLVAVATNPGPDSALDRYGRAIATGALALIAFASLWWRPFTEDYARETVPREYWSSPRFRQANRAITTVWAGAFAVMAVSHLVAGLIDTRRAETVFNWAIPIALIVYAAKYTTRRASAAGAEPAAAGTAG